MKIAFTSVLLAGAAVGNAFTLTDSFNYTQGTNIQGVANSGYTWGSWNLASNDSNVVTNGG